MKSPQLLRVRLPLLVCGVLSFVLAVTAATAYREMRRVAVATAGERLVGVTTRLASLFGMSAAQIVRQGLPAARDTTVRAFLRDPSPATSAATRAALVAVRAPTTAAVTTELWAPDGRRLLATDARWPELDASARRAMIARLASHDSVAVGPLDTARGVVASSLIARVGDGPRPLGYVVEWRRLTLNVSGATDPRRQLRELIGSDAAFYLGNARGDVWTDLRGGVAAPPPLRALRDGRVVRYERAGVGEQLGAMRAVPSTPWVLAIEFPYDTVVAGPRSALGRLVAFAALVLAVGALAAWTLTRRLTRPLAVLADAAHALQNGDYSRRVSVGRADELGSVALAFNEMAESVAVARGQLEHQVVQLDTARGQLRHVLASSGAVIYRSRDDAGAATMTWISDNVERILGYTAAEACAPGWWLERVHPEDRGRVTAPSPHDDVAETAREYRFRRADGTYRWLRDTRRVVRDERGGAEIVGAWLDITDHRALEEQLRQAQKMEAVGRLAGGVAHDFNNLLSVILAECELALGDVDEYDPVRTSLAAIRDATVRASHVTRQLLTFSRKQLVAPAALDLNEVVEQTMHMLRRLVGEDVTLVPALANASAGANALGVVRADRGQVEQVLVNLVLNARDAMSGPGPIVIETSNVRLDAHYADAHPGLVAGEYVMLAVSDTGVGMPPEVQARLFEPFFTTKALGRGTGLGLATCYGIVRDLGGHIGVYSEVGRGTTMKVYLPRVESAADGAPAAPAPSARGDETILLVEDDAQVRAATARILTAHGYVVLAASDGEDALRCAAEHAGRIDLLLTDVVLPRLGGRVLAERMAVERPGVRTLFVSGYTEDVILRHRLLRRDIAMLQKPFTVEALTRKVRETLDGPPPVPAGQSA